MSIKDIANRIKQNIASAWNSNQTNPQNRIDVGKKGNVVEVIAASQAIEFANANEKINDALEESFVHTAKLEDSVIKHGEENGITRKSATKSSGNVVFLGSNGTNIPKELKLTDSDGNEFITKNQVTISNYSYAISSISLNGIIATINTSIDNIFYNSQTVNISGSDNEIFNGDFVITKLASNQFQITLSSITTVPTLGNMIVSAVMGYSSVESVGFGSDNNKSSSSSLQLVIPIEDVDDFAYVSFEGLLGAVDLEDKDDYAKRIWDAKKSYGGGFSADGIELFLKENFSEIGRVWVNEATPSAGQVQILFTDVTAFDLLPSQKLLDEVKNKVCASDDRIMPANTDISDVFVISPTKVEVNLIVSNLSPNVQSLKDSIESNLRDLFGSEQINLSETVSIADITQTINNTVDETGNTPISFSLTPNSDIVVNQNELAILSNVSFV